MRAGARAELPRGSPEVDPAAAVMLMLLGLHHALGATISSTLSEGQWGCAWITARVEGTSFTSKFTQCGSDSGFKQVSSQTLGDCLGGPCKPCHEVWAQCHVAAFRHHLDCVHGTHNHNELCLLYPCSHWSLAVQGSSVLGMGSQL